MFWIDDAKRQALAEAVEQVVRREGYTEWACAICANHVHLVVRIHRDNGVTMWEKFGHACRLRLRTPGSFPEVGAEHPVWAERPYDVFLYTPEEVRGRVEYVANNPEKEGLARQVFAFVTGYDGWPLHKCGGEAKTQVVMGAKGAGWRG